MSADLKRANIMPSPFLHSCACLPHFQNTLELVQVIDPALVSLVRASRDGDSGEEALEMAKIADGVV